MGLFDVLDDLFDDLAGIFGGDDDDDNDGPPVAADAAACCRRARRRGGRLRKCPTAPVGYSRAPIRRGPPISRPAARSRAPMTSWLACSSRSSPLTMTLARKSALSSPTSRQRVGTLTANPQMANDPYAMALFNQFLDGQLAQIQQILDGAKVDSKKQAELLAALGDEYRGTGGGGHSKDGKDGKDGTAGSGSGDGGADTSGDGTGGGSGAGDGGSAGGAGGTTTGGGPGGLTDPLAGLGGLGGAGMGDPLSMLGPAMAGLGAIPGALGGAAGSLPMDALGAMGPLASGLAGAGGGDGFKDSDAHDHGKSDDLDDGSHGKGDGDGGKNGEQASGKGDSGDKNGPIQPASTTAAAAGHPAGAAGWGAGKCGR